MNEKNDDLPARADALVARHNPREEFPFFREKNFVVKLRREGSKVGKIKQRTVDPAQRYLNVSEWRETLRLAGLTARECATLGLVIRGDSLSGIAVAEGVSRQAVHQRFQRIVEKIRLAYDVYPYAGLADVYRSELKRGDPQVRLR